MEWLPDPAGRHDYRLWDGERWDDRVADGGETSQDPLSEQLPPPDALLEAGIPSKQRRVAGSLITALFWLVPCMLGAQSASLDDRGDSEFLAIVFLVAAHAGLIAFAAWTISAWGEGANPAKCLLGMRVVDEATRRPLGSGKMLLRALIRLLPVTWPASAVMVLVRNDRKSLADLMLGSLVVDSRHAADRGLLHADSG